MQLANFRCVHVFWKEILVSVSSRTVRLSFHIWPRIGCSITHSFNFWYRTLREWAGVRGIDWSPDGSWWISWAWLPVFLWRVLHTSMVSRLEDTRQFDGHLVRKMTGKVSPRRCPLRLMSAMNKYLQEQAKDAISRAQHTTRKENVNLESGTWVMYFRRGKVTRGAIGAPSKSGLWLDLLVSSWLRPYNNGAGQIGVVWSHGNKLIRCHPTQLRRCSEREVSIASLKCLVQISVPTSVTELTNALSPGQCEDLSTSLPTGDDLRFGEVDLEAPPVDQETMAPSFVPLFPSGTVVTPSQNTSAQLSSIPNPVSASSDRQSDVQIDESFSTPGSIQISPRELTRSQGELARSSLEMQIV